MRGILIGMNRRTHQKDEWASLRYENSATYGETVFFNMPYRSGPFRSMASRLTMWVTAEAGRETEPGAWLFHAKLGGHRATETQTVDLLATLLVFLEAHGIPAGGATFRQIAELARKPQIHIPDRYRKLARGHMRRRNKEPDLVQAK